MVRLAVRSCASIICAHIYVGSISLKIDSVKKKKDSVTGETNAQRSKITQEAMNHITKIA